MYFVIHSFEKVHSMEEAARRAQWVGAILKRIPGFKG